MIDKKYNKILTVILVIVVIIIFALLGFWGYETYQKYAQGKDINDALNEFNTVINSNNGNVIRRNEVVNGNNSNDGNFSFNLDINETTNGGSSNGNGNKTVTYKGFTVLGTMEIPAIDFKYPVLERATKSSLEASVGVLIGPGLNKVGNTLIVGHNYRNGTFFSRNKELKNGDVIYITDISGTKVKDTIYNIYTTSSDDASYMTRDTAGKREVSLSTCTEDSKYRLVIWAKED